MKDSSHERLFRIYCDHVKLNSPNPQVFNPASEAELATFAAKFKDIFNFECPEDWLSIFTVSDGLLFDGWSFFGTKAQPPYLESLFEYNEDIRDLEPDLDFVILGKGDITLFGLEIATQQIHDYDVGVLELCTHDINPILYAMDCSKIDPETGLRYDPDTGFLLPDYMSGGRTPSPGAKTSRHATNETLGKKVY